MNTHVLDPFILSLITFVPLGGALLLMVFPRRERDIRAFTLAVAVLTFILSLHLPVHFVWVGGDRAQAREAASGGKQ